jgi:hypothetical protein
MQSTDNKKNMSEFGAQSVGFEPFFSRQSNPQADVGPELRAWDNPDAQTFAAIAQNVSDFAPLDVSATQGNLRETLEAVFKSTVDAFDDASRHEGGNSPVDVANPSFVNATSAIQRITRKYDKDEIKQMQECVRRSVEDKQALADYNGRYEPKEQLIDLAFDTLKNSKTWVSNRWRDGISKAHVNGVEVLDEAFRQKVARYQITDQSSAGTHYDLPTGDGIVIFLEIPGKDGRVIPLHQCTMTRAAMAAGGRLFHEMQHKKIPVETLHEQMVSLDSSQLFSCPKPLPQTEISVSLVDMFNPVHKFQANPMGSLVRISLTFDSYMGRVEPNCFSLAPKFFSPEGHPADKNWPADSLVAWYALAHQKIEELASMYNNEISVMLARRRHRGRSQLEALNKLLELHAEANECLTTLGYNPQRLTDPFLGNSLDPATAPSRPPNLPAGVPNNAITRKDILERFAQEVHPCTVLDAAC